MKKLIAGLILVGMLVGLLMPVAVSADTCTERCCYLYDFSKYYNVSYFDESHDWVTEQVEAWTAREAAEKLDLRAGYDCIVGYNSTDFEPVLNSYKVSYFDASHNWTIEYVQAESSKDAALQLGLRAGYDCFVGKV